MAEALAKSLAGPAWEIWSAGSHPSGYVHPLATQLMAERHLSLATHRSKGLADVPSQVWDYVVTMGCGNQCPAVRARHRIDWQIPDPGGLSLEAAREARDRIETLVHALVARHKEERDG